MVIDPQTSEPTRVVHSQVEGKWVRTGKRSGNPLDKA